MGTPGETNNFDLYFTYEAEDDESGLGFETFLVWFVWVFFN